MIIEKICAFLCDEVNGVAPSLESLKWGDEVCRLAPPAEQTFTISETGKPEDYPTLEGFEMPAPPEGFVNLSMRFLIAFVDVFGSIQRSHGCFRSQRERLLKMVLMSKSYTCRGNRRSAFTSVARLTRRLLLKLRPRSLSWRLQRVLCVSPVLLVNVPLKKCRRATRRRLISNRLSTQRIR